MVNCQKQNQIFKYMALLSFITAIFIGYPHSSNAGEINRQLAYAAYKGKLEKVKELLASGADPNSQTENGRTALMAASVKGRANVAKFLLNHGADPNIQANDKETALMLAVYKGRLEIIRLLLENNAKVDLEENNGLTALFMASSIGSKRAVELLLDHGADATKKYLKGVTCWWVALNRGHKEVAKLINYKGRSPIVQAVEQGDTSKVVELIKGGVDIESREPKLGATLLMVAADAGHLGLFRTLLNMSADVNATSHNGYTALSAAANSGRKEIVELLLKNNAKVNAQESIFGSTPLIRAAGKGYTDIVKILIEHGADPNIKDNDGQTAYDLAKSQGREEVMKILEANNRPPDNK